MDFCELRQQRICTVYCLKALWWEVFNFVRSEAKEILLTGLCFKENSKRSCCFVFSWGGNLFILCGLHRTPGGTLHLITQAAWTELHHRFNWWALWSRPIQLCYCSLSTLSLQCGLYPGDAERFRPSQVVRAPKAELSPFLPPGAGCASSQSGCLSLRPRLDRCRREWPAALPTCAAAIFPSGRWTRPSTGCAPAGLRSLDALEENRPHTGVSVHLQTSI